MAKWWKVALVVGLSAGCGEASSPSPSPPPVVETEEDEEEQNPTDVAGSEFERERDERPAPPAARCAPRTCEGFCGDGDDGCGDALTCDACREIVSIDVLEPEMAMVRGQTKMIDHVVRDELLRVVLNPDLTWTSTREHVASVKDGGEVFAAREGRTIIELAGSNTSAAVWLVVLPEPAEIERRMASGCAVDDRSCVTVR